MRSPLAEQVAEFGKQREKRGMLESQPWNEPMVASKTIMKSRVGALSPGFSRMNMHFPKVNT